MNRDLTVGKPQKVLWHYCIPLFGSVLFQQMYNIADSFVVGKLIGEEALASVGNSYEVTLIFIAIAFGCNIGCTVVTSGFFGAKDYKKVKSAVSTALISNIILCLLLMLAGILLCDECLRLINTPVEIFADSKLYLDIYLYGLPFLFIYNISNGIFSALGDSTTPFRFLAISSVSNVLVDILFVKQFDMGVAGVAWATFLCQGVSCILSVIFLIRRVRSLETEGRIVLFSFDIFKKIARIAIPSILQQSSVSIGNIIIQRVINGFGPGVIAGYAAAVKLNNLVTTCIMTMGNGISTYTAQNIGAKKYERVSEGFKAGVRIAMCLAVPFALLYFFGGSLMVKLFLTQPSKDALQNGVWFLRIVSPFYLLITVKLVSDGILRGATHMKEFFTGTFTDLVIRVICAMILSKQIGSIGIWISWPIGWVIATFISLYFYKKLDRTEMKQLEFTH